MPHCLLVDDDAEIRTSVQSFLQRFGLEVSVAATAGEMRALMAQRRFDVIVLDLMLPDDNGLVLCKWVQQTTRTPVIGTRALGNAACRAVAVSRPCGLRGCRRSRRRQ